MTDPASIFPGNVEAAFVRLEGKIDLLVTKLDHQAEETGRIRDRLHDHAQHLATLTGLNIPEKLTAQRKLGDEHDKRLTSLERDREQRKGAMSVMRALWALIGFIGGGSIVAVIKTLGVI